MFLDTGKIGPPPVAEGVYWLLMPLAMAMAIPPLIVWFGHIAEQTLVPALVTTLDFCRVPLVAAANLGQEALLKVTSVLPNAWATKVPLIPSASSEAVLFSYAGGAYLMSLFGAGLQRAWGRITGAFVAIGIALVLGATHAGVWIMGLSYVLGVLLFVTDALTPLGLLGEGENDNAIAFPVVVPPALAVVFLAVNALF